jgi:hypothetical protein
LALIVEGDAVRTLQAADLGDQFSALRVDDHDAVEASDIEQVGRFIDFEIVPAAIASKLPGVLNFEGSGGSSLCW